MRTIFALGLLALVACGASHPPAQTAATASDSSATATTPADTAAPSRASEPAPAATPELLAGIKAFDAANYADARKSFETASKKNANDYQALFNLGATDEKLGDKVAAEAAYKQALAAKPDLDAAAAALSSLYIDAGRIDEAIAVARAGLAKHADSAPLHENLGIALATRGDRDAALEQLDAAVQIAPGEPMYRLAIAQWLNQWKVRGAAPHLDAALPLAKSDYGMLAAIGHEYRMAGEFDACIKTFDRLVAQKDGGEVRTERALCKLGRKDEGGALDDLKAAVAREPAYAPGHYYLGGRLAMNRRFKEAAAEYSKYLELAPGGSLAKQAGERLKAAQEAARGDKDKGAKPKK